MRTAHALFILAMACSASALHAGQSPTNEAPGQTAPAAPAAPLPPSGVLQPSLDSVKQTLDAVKVDKWKRGSVRDEAGANINSILHDMEANLPPLLTAADAAPGQISKTLPLSRHVDALYDVLLRVVEAARVSAPADQVAALEQTLLGLSKARLALSDSMQETAAAQEKQISDLRSSLQAQIAANSAAKPAAPPPNCAAPTPARKPRKKRAAPATAPQQAPAPAPGTPKPQ